MVELKTRKEEDETGTLVVINGSRVAMIKDYQFSVSKDLIDGSSSPINLPKSNVLQFFLEDGSKISVRPSGTEPKIKFYFGVKENLADIADFVKVNEMLDKRVRDIITDMKLA